MVKRVLLVPLLLLLAVHNIYAGFGDLGKAIKKGIETIESKKCATDGWCVHGTATLSWTDCDADGFPDAVCTDGWGRFGFISSKGNCQRMWPIKENPPCYSVHGPVCRRSRTWCNAPAQLSFKDCDGDGIPDPTCSWQGKLWVIQSSQGCRSVSGATCVNRDELVRKWAPQVRLHHNEEFMPSSVDFFLRNVNLKGGRTPGALTPSNLPACNGNCYLDSKESLGGASGTRPAFLKGQDPRNVPVYAIVEDKGRDTLEITYWTFYPYNRGKRVCIGVFSFAGCIGGYSTFGHHVGDWERVRVKLVKGQPQWYYLWIHGSEVTNKYGGAFNWNGREFMRGNKALAMYQGHPVVYSADGSHGIWPNGGKHTYKKLPNGDTLADYTGDGGKYWNTWNNLKIVNFNKYRSYSGEFQFLEFQGRWGNRKSDCGIAAKISGECILNDGPKGPPK